MNDKVFEALSELEEEAKWCNHDGETLTKYDEERFNVIKQALLELKEIKEAKPSEALEDSLKLYKMVESAGNGKDFDLVEAWKYHSYLVEAWKYHDTIKQTLTTKSKKEQAFDVIVEKPFVCANAINYIKINKKNPVMLDYDHYCMAVNLVLKEKDYEILKEAILNED